MNYRATFGFSPPGRILKPVYPLSTARPGRERTCYSPDVSSEGTLFPFTPLYKNYNLLSFKTASNVALFIVAWARYFPYKRKLQSAKAKHANLFIWRWCLFARTDCWWQAVCACVAPARWQCRESTFLITVIKYWWRQTGSAKAANCIIYVQ